jgi:hypothetical protein
MSPVAIAKRDTRRLSYPRSLALEKTLQLREDVIPELCLRLDLRGEHGRVGMWHDGIRVLALV